MGEAASAESLEELFEGCRQGDERAFAAVYRRLGRALYGAALRILGQSEEAEDAVQETFMTFYDRRVTIDPAQAGGWLRRVLVNRCIDRIRRRRRRPETELADDTVAAGGRRHALHLDLARAASRLPDRARLVFVLHDVEGFKHREVAALLGITEGATKSQLFRARGLLRGHLERGPGDPS